ncbi:MAG: ATP-grasp ribosomal peptide maturase [Pseudonocardia sp.]
MTVLIVTAHDDDTATRVCDALHRRARDHLRIDLGDFPDTLSLSATGPDPGWTGTLHDGHRELALDDVEAVYWRWPTTFRMPDHLDPQQRRFAVAEARQGLGGIISCLPVPFVSHPARIADAELKPAQLHTAAQLGLLVPPTLITSDGQAAREFVRRHRRVLYKPFTATFLRTEDRTKLVYATLIDSPAEIDDAAVALAPCQFQAFITKRHDVRLTVVGTVCLAVAIHAGSDPAYVDWRADYPSLTYQTVPTPDPIATAVTGYLDRFGLASGCFDFTVDHDNRWWFLECGANAQWGWLEHETGAPIADAIARRLTTARPAPITGPPGAPGRRTA